MKRLYSTGNSPMTYDLVLDSEGHLVARAISDIAASLIVEALNAAQNSND